MERSANDQIFIRLYIDADITVNLARILRSQGYDAISARETPLESASDEVQMAHAAQEGRTLLTCNSRHFDPLFDQYWKEGRDHSGLITSEQLELGEMLRRVAKLLDTITADEMRNAWKNLGEFKDEP